ncbi:MAG: hypothetical protein Q4A82_03185 [Corynebacterium sp.]|nr:hypothetical protein [Corynebacterium sp.]
MQQLEVPNIRAVIRVQEFSPHQSDPQVVINDLARIAREERGDILVESATLSGRTVYGAGKNADQWIQNGYRGLPGTPHLEFIDFSQLPHTDYRQAIELSGSAAFEKRVTEYLEARDIPIAFLENLHWEMLLRGSALGYLTWLLVGMCLAFCVIGVVLNSHADAVRRLHGYGVLRSGVYELRRAGGTTFWVLVAAVVGVTVVMLFWTSMAVVQQWLYHQLVFIGMSLVACVVGTFGALVLLRQLSVTNMLSGKLPGKTVLTSMYIIRAGVCIVAAAMSIGLTNYGAEWLKQRPERQIWETAQQTYAVGISGARSDDGFRKAEGIFGPKLRELSAQGTLIYRDFTAPGAMPFSGLDRPILTYNETAAKQSLQGELRRVVDNLQIGDQPILVQPDNLPSTVDIDAIRPDLTWLGANPQWQVVTYPATGSRAFTWEIGVSEWMNRAEVVDPVVVIYPNRHLFISDRNLFAAVTQHDILLTDPADYQRLQADSQVGALVKSITPVSQEWAAHHQTMGRTVWVYAGGLLIALLLCAISALAVFLRG